MNERKFFMRSDKKVLRTSISSILLAILICVSGCSRPDVVMLGDSVFAFSPVALFLEKLSGESYRHYYVSGSKMVNDIPTQYETAKEMGDINIIITDGGINDILLAGNAPCLDRIDGSISEECWTIIDEVTHTVEALFITMRNDGVQDIIFLGDFIRELSVITDADNALTDLIKDIASKYEYVHFIETREIFKGQFEYIFIDGLHPSVQGAEVIANLIWNATKRIENY